MATLFQTQLLSSLGNKTKYLAELKKTFARPLIQREVKTDTFIIKYDKI